jgi:hypothetical protein
MNVRISGTHGKAANRRKQVSRTLAHVFAGWRTGLSGPVIDFAANSPEIPSNRKILLGAPPTSQIEQGVFVHIDGSGTSR